MIAEVRGINVHAQQLVGGRDRNAVERLARYMTRPPFAQERLVRLPDGRVELTLKSVWQDGTRALVFEPDELVTRLAAAVPPPRWHLLRYFGVLSSTHAGLRHGGMTASFCGTGKAALAVSWVGSGGLWPVRTAERVLRYGPLRHRMRRLGSEPSRPR